MFSVLFLVRSRFKFYCGKVLMALNLSEPTDEQLEQLEKIKTSHDEAYLYISQGLSYQERNQYSLARDMYEKGLEKIDGALNIRCDRPFCHGPKWDNARMLQQKMRKTYQTVKSQLREIQNCSDSPTTNGMTNNLVNSQMIVSQNCTDSPAAMNGATNLPYVSPDLFELPPSYDEACEHELLVSRRRSSCPVNSASQNGHRKGSAEVIELFSVQDQVLLFYVSNDGSVNAQSSQSSLHIYQFVDEETIVSDTSCPPAWLQIGNWTYPLIPGKSPVLESGYGAFLFPNVGAGQGSAVGVILPPTVTAAERAKFLEILNSFTAFKEETIYLGPEEQKYSLSLTSKGPGPVSDLICRGIIIGAEYASIGLVKGASLASELIHKGGSKARDNINPEDQPVVVDPRVKEGLRIAREASSVALKATGYLVRKLGELTLALGKQLAPHIKEQGTKLLTAFNKDSKEANDAIDGVLNVAASGIQGFSTIYMGLEHAAKTLAYSLSSETVNIVGHKYGSEVGELVGNAVFSIGNLALTTHNVHSLGVKAIAKRTAKETGKAVLKDYIGNETKDGK